MLTRARGVNRKTRRMGTRRGAIEKSEMQNVRSRMHVKKKYARDVIKIIGGSPLNTGSADYVFRRIRYADVRGALICDPGIPQPRPEFSSCFHGPRNNRSVTSHENLRKFAARRLYDSFVTLHSIQTNLAA